MTPMFNTLREALDYRPAPAALQHAATGRLYLHPSPPEDGPYTYDCLLIGAGKIRQADGEESSWLIPADVLRNSAPLFQGIASYLDHPALFGFGWEQRPRLRDLAGVVLDAHWDEAEQGIAGKIRLYPTQAGDLLSHLYTQMLQDRNAGLDTPDIGLSAVIWHRSHLDETTGLRITDEITRVDSVDHVYSAGARGYVRAALARIGWTSDASRSPYIPTNGSALPTTSGAAAPDSEGDPNMTSTDNLGQAPTHAGPQPPTEDPILEALNTITARLDRIEQANAQAEEPATVEGMGSPPRGHTFGMTIGIDHISQAAEAMLAGVRPPAGIRPLSGIRELYTLLSGDYEMTGIYNAERVYLANVTSSTMAQLVANILNKRVMIAFAEYPQWWRPITTIENFTSLQQIRWITMGGIGELPTVAEGAAYTELTWDDIAQRNSFVKKGGYLGITLEAIDKDDTRQVQLAPRALAQAAWLTLSKTISELFTSNSGVGPNVYYDDSNTRALFHTSNSNLGTTALSAAAWSATRIAMRKQTEHNSSERLGALTAPRFLLVPPDLEFTAIQVLATEQIPGSANWNANPEAAGDTLNARLSAARERVVVVDLWTDTNNWAAVADPRLYPTIGLGFRFGETPEIFSVADPRAGLMFSNDVMPIKARFFYAAGPVDYRGLYKHNVT